LKATYSLDLLTRWTVHELCFFTSTDNATEWERRSDSYSKKEEDECTVLCRNEMTNLRPQRKTNDTFFLKKSIVRTKVQECKIAERMLNYKRVILFPVKNLEFHLVSHTNDKCISGVHTLKIVIRKFS
jgi:hypothetical protein